MEDENLFSVKQVAIVLKVHPLSVRRYIKEGKLKASKLGGNIRISQSSIDDFRKEVYPSDYSNHKISSPSVDRTETIFSDTDSLFRLKGIGLSIAKLS